jgi:hypothetical protein
MIECKVVLIAYFSDRSQEFTRRLAFPRIPVLGDLLCFPFADGALEEPVELIAFKDVGGPVAEAVVYISAQFADATAESLTANGWEAA